jgi:hypothetical protein
MSTYQLIDGRVKIQVEDALGTAPTGGWVYQAPGVGNAGAEGAHYYYRSQTLEGSHKTVPKAGHFGFTVEITEAGTYGILLRAIRDTNSPPDARNDIWIQVDGDTRAVMPEGAPELVHGGQGFVKFKGAQTSWSQAKTFSAEEEGVDNAASNVVLGVGLHSIVFAPRSTGFHIDSFQVVQRSVLPPEPEPEPENLIASARVAARANDAETLGGAADADLDLGSTEAGAGSVGLRFTGLALEAGAAIEAAYFVFTASADSAAGGDLTIEIQNNRATQNFVNGWGIDARSYLAETVAWTDIGAWTAGETYRSADISSLIEALVGGGGPTAADALAFRLSGSGSRAAQSFDGDPAAAPELVIEYL